MSTTEQQLPTTPFWGACGTESCAECLPLFDKDNHVIEGTDV